MGRVGLFSFLLLLAPKAALVFAMFHERMASFPPSASTSTVEETIRIRVRRLIGEFGGAFGKVMAELIVEGQSDPAVLRELYDQHIRTRRAQTIGDIGRAKVPSCGIWSCSAHRHHPQFGGPFAETGLEQA